MSAKYKLQALCLHRHQLKDNLIADCYKKHVKKASVPVSQETEMAVLSMSISEIQQALIRQVIDNQEGILHVITIEEIVQVYL